jgi:hypothetical protein
MRVLAFSKSAIVLVATVTAPSFAVAVEPTAPAKLARDDPKRVVCRRQSVTGSLVQAVKICRTNAEWRGLTRSAEDAGSEMQQRGLVNSCGATEPGRC